MLSKTSLISTFKVVSLQTYVLVKWARAVFSCIKIFLKEDPCKNEMWQLTAFKTFRLTWYKNAGCFFFKFCTFCCLVFLQVGIVLLITLSLKIMFDAPKSERALVAGCGWNCRREGCGKDTNSGNVCKRIVYIFSQLWALLKLVFCYWFGIESPQIVYIDI